MVAFVHVVAFYTRGKSKMSRVALLSPETFGGCGDEVKKKCRPSQSAYLYFLPILSSFFLQVRAPVRAAFAVRAEAVSEIHAP